MDNPHLQDAQLNCRLLQNNASEQKKQRNRVAQRAHRRRQQDYISELEKRIEDLSKSDDERIIKLENENKLLRQWLSKIADKLESAGTSLKSLSQSASETLQPFRNESTEDIEQAHMVSGSEIGSAVECVGQGMAFPGYDSSDFATPTEGASSWQVLSDEAISHHDWQSAMHPSESCIQTAVSMPQDTDAIFFSNGSSLGLETTPHEEPETSDLITTQQGIEVLHVSKPRKHRSGSLERSSSGKPPMSNRPSALSYDYQINPAAFQSAMVVNAPNMSTSFRTNSVLSDQMYCMQNALHKRSLSVAHINPTISSS